MILRIFFFFFNNTDIEFVETKKFTWKIYTIIEALSIIGQIKFINKIKFTKVLLDKNSYIVIIYIIILEVNVRSAHFFDGSNSYIIIK